MADNQWNQQLMDFLKRTGEDLKRTGKEIQSEAQRILAEVRDPETQAKMKESVSNFGTWAKKTAEDAAGMIEQAVKKAEDQVRTRMGKSGESGGGTAEGVGQDTASPPETAPRATAPRTNQGAPAKKKATKTVGRKPAGGGSRKPGIGSAKAKKPLGKKK